MSLRALARAVACEVVGAAPRTVARVVTRAVAGAVVCVAHCGTIDLLIFGCGPIVRGARYCTRWERVEYHYYIQNATIVDAMACRRVLACCGDCFNNFRNANKFLRYC